MPFQRYISLAISVLWLFGLLFGYLFLHWDIGQNLVFLNVGLFALFFNYYLGMAYLSFREHVHSQWKRRQQIPASEFAWKMTFKVITFVLNVFIITFALAISVTISGAFIATYFYKVLKVEDFQQLQEKWTNDWTWVVGLSVLILLIEGALFLRELIVLNTQKLVTWEAFAPFAKNTRKKLNTYFFGSALIIPVDGLFNTEATFGYLSLVWVFIVTAYWTYLDVRYPAQEMQSALQTDEKEL